MNSDAVFDTVEGIAATNSKLEKLALMKSAVGSAEFLTVMKAAYDPFKVYGMTSVALPPIAGSDQFDAKTWGVIGSISERALTGHAAIAAVESETGRLSAKSAELLKRILLKDMRAGFSEGSVNKASPGAIPEFPYMRCSLPPKSNMAKWDWSLAMFSQDKADGMFANTNLYADGTVVITSRQGTQFPLGQLHGIVRFFQEHMEQNRQYHGEFVVEVKDLPLPREVSNGIMNSLANGGELEEGQVVTLSLWDAIPMECVKAKDSCDTPYEERYNEILTGLNRGPLESAVRMIGTRRVYSRDQALEHYRHNLKAGKEGTVLKHPMAIWKDHTSKDQVKFKLEVVVELEVVGFNEGEGQYVGSLGSLVMRSADGLLEVNVSGRGTDMRQNVWDNRPAWLGAIGAVKANSIMSPSEEGGKHSLFLPVWVERRTDKDKADTLEEIQDQFKAAVEG